MRNQKWFTSLIVDVCFTPNFQTTIVCKAMLVPQLSYRTITSFASMFLSISCFNICSIIHIVKRDKQMLSMLG